MNAKSQIRELEARIAAQAETIECLMDMAERNQQTRSESSFTVFEQVITLEEIIRSKTATLEATIHELKTTQSQLLQSQKLESVGQLASGIAHEINTPMQYIGDNIKFLEKSFDRILEIIATVENIQGLLQNQPGAQHLHSELSLLIEKCRLGFLKLRIPKALQQTMEGVDSVSRIVRAMKEFSHPGTDERVPVDLNQIISSTLVVSRNEWKYVANIHASLDPELPFVWSIPGELNQVLLNLIVNAAQAIAEVVGRPQEEQDKGNIWIETCRSGGDSVCIKISDTGCGIPEAIQHRIFDPFFTTKEVGRGTGQGLPIARSIIVDRHQGEICFEARPGGGTCFTITLPLANPT